MGVDAASTRGGECQESIDCGGCGNFDKENVEAVFASLEFETSVWDSDEDARRRRCELSEGALWYEGSREPDPVAADGLGSLFLVLK